MIECIFTIDYELYGNGQGRLGELVYEPTRRLQTLFNRAGVCFVIFVEAVELWQIDRQGTDDALPLVRSQIRELHEQGYEIGLHLHPQWANARFRGNQWQLDYAEYNLCVLPGGRITQVVDEALAWLRCVVNDPGFTPLAFRAGNWLFQPTRTVARILASRGIRIDSSVFVGGVQHQHGLDYRAAITNGAYWRFSDDVTVSDPRGVMLELPIHTEMVPFWRMLTSKRVGLQQKSRVARSGAALPGRPRRRVGDFRDYLRLRHPMKFDFCRMTLGELTAMVERAMVLDAPNPSILKPMVAIGHTKDLLDLDTIESFLAFLKRRGIPVHTFASLSSRWATLGYLGENRDGVSCPAEQPLVSIPS